jgi:alkylation response protein AidB-like acyl-CoA dehydrogenase
VNLEPTDEQRMLAETIDDLLDKTYDANTRLRLLSSPGGWGREQWQRYAEMGLLGLCIDEEYGGAGMGVGELAVVLEAFGRYLVLEPYLATVVLGASLVTAAATPEQKAAILPGVAAGTTTLALAHTEPGSRWSLTDLDGTARPAGEGWTIDAQKITVLGGDSADQIVVTARTPDGPVGLFLVDADADGVRREAYPMQDGLRGADIVFDHAPATALGSPENAVATLAGVLDLATAMLCAEAVGAMDRMLWLTRDYLKARVQFGRPIATFQVLQHRAADMYVSLEQARSLALVARLALTTDDSDDTGESGDPAAARRLVWAAKLGVDAAARHIGQEAVQLHGGIGMTMEYPVGHYLKRTSVIARTFADDDELVERVGRDGGLIPAG